MGSCTIGYFISFLPFFFLFSHSPSLEWKLEMAEVAVELQFNYLYKSFFYDQLFSIAVYALELYGSSDMTIPKFITYLAFTIIDVFEFVTLHLHARVAPHPCHSTMCNSKNNVNWPNEVKPRLNVSHRLYTKNSHICFILTFYWFKIQFAQNFQGRSNNISSQHVLGFTVVDCFTAAVHKFE